MSSSKQRVERPHVLFVTDDEDLREFLSEGLVIAGFWVSTVASALQTLEVFRLRTFDLAIVDLAISGMTATELIKRLRTESPNSAQSQARTDIPLLALADNPNQPEVAEAFRAGADDVLVPPLELDQLASHLHDVVRLWRSAHPDRPYADEVAKASGGQGY
jgi:DNA-binding response OmpR family regulator